MNILYVAHELGLGGATRSLLSVIDLMKKKGHTIYVLSPSKEGTFYDELKKRDVKVLHGKYYSWMSGSRNIYDKPIALIKFILNKVFISKFIRTIEDYEIDVIHTNTTMNYIGAQIGRYLKIPHVWHIREFAEEDHGLHFIFDREKSLKMINDFSNKIIFVSKSLYSKYENVFDKDKCIVIYNGIPEGFLQEKPFFQSNDINILISGALQEGKGQKEAIYAISHLFKKGYTNMKLFIAGTGNHQYERELIQIISENNLEENITMIGYINDIKELRATMHLELVCSKSEAFGRVTVEAMMSMNPVIATDTGANPELIVNNENGLLYHQGDFVDLANKIEHFLKNPQELSRMGRNGYEYAYQHYTAQRNADEIEKVYYAVMK